MKTLELNQMENVEGGTCSSGAEKFIAVTGTVATIAGFFVPIGAIIAGPTALGMGIAGIVCAFE